MNPLNFDDKILIVDDEENIRLLFTRTLEGLNINILEASNGAEAIKMITDDPTIRIVFSDIRMPEMDGMELIERINQLDNPPTIILFSAYGTEDTIFDAAQKNAYDFLSKPLSPQQIQNATIRAIERENLLKKNRDLQQEIEKSYNFENIVAKSKTMRDIFELVKKIARHDTTILIEGESGTGKEVIAKLIHNNSLRRKNKFIPVNCAAIPENLLESEFFGYVKGAFTGADRDKKGLFEEADKGTLFLDEVAELPLSLQAKLLRVLQDQEIRRIGENISRKIDVRVIAATNKDMKTVVREGKFREDLYYRLNVVNITIPPLRKRKEDIPSLINFFIDIYNRRHSKAVRNVDKVVLKLFLQYPWPGNVRELENTIERSILMCDKDIITTEHIPKEIINNIPDDEIFDIEKEFNIKKVCREIETKLIRKALEETNGNRTKAAELLGISLRALMYKIKDYNIN